MKTVLVPGGAGGVGTGIVGALLDAGYAVIATSRNAMRLESLREYLGPVRTARLRLLVAEAGESEGAEALRDRLEREVGPLDAVVPSLGGWWEGRLLDVTPELWDALMNEFLRAHFVFARTFIPALLAQPGGGRYIAIGGGAAYFPVPNSAPVSIAAAAQLMLTRALRTEVADPRVDILELVVDGPVYTRDSASIAQPDWITADEVGAIVVDLVTNGFTGAPSTTASGPILRMRPTRGTLADG